MIPEKEDCIYLDHNATTPVCSEALASMLPYLKEDFGNPSSAHMLGKVARQGIENAREEVAALVGCQSHEIIFTSGGSESNNMVLKGMLDFQNLQGCHIITSAIEHPAILNPALFLMELGVEITILPVDSFGCVDPDEVYNAIQPNTRLISIMLANNETGTLQPITRIAAIAKAHGVPIHTDAAQAVGKIEININSLGVDFLSIAGHKLYGPKGVGALFLRDGQSITPLIHGAAQENGKRAGTENIILAVGLGTACEIARRTLKEEIKRISTMRDRLQGILFENIKDLVLNGHPTERLPNTLNISIPGIAGEQILEALPNIIASTGAACHDRTVKLSHVLAAMGVPAEIGMGAIRLTLGKNNSHEQLMDAAGLIIRQIRRMQDARNER